MAEKRLGVIMNGVTGRMGTNQHLVRSVLEINKEGGVVLKDGTRVVLDPILVGRNADKVSRLAKAHGVERWTTDLDAALADKKDELFFDAASTQLRAALVKKAITAGKHIYVEKPTADTLEDAQEIYRLAKKAGIKHGVVQDKLYLPGLLKLKMLRQAGFFGRILSCRIDFGYWVFEGDLQPIQRPSWNYRKADGGGIVLDMMPHWRYVVDNVFGNMTGLFCMPVNHIEKRWDEQGQPYKADCDDAAYAILQLEGGAVAQINFDWNVRVRRDDLVTFKIDGTHGSAVAGLVDCWTQERVNTPRPVWNPDTSVATDYFKDWQKMPTVLPPQNAFRIEWEMFIRHLYDGAPFPHGLLEGAKGLQTVELAFKSWAEKRWVEVPKLED
ncbi:Gfo/Idh/MocA family protein [Shumkonia mesophila]|uniref:Gfo/Idh/MocA family protein n=1 Tax=Shumkonia mesophila TaxID=2838854 RepID=UPI0029341601|nr:Gfo/Idh/MocA family oxidoreductase [Shumkonia mesophila]